MTTSPISADISAGKDRTWFITGASTGFGWLLAEEDLTGRNSAAVVVTQT
jgi:NAD(P)-dependent dehydrogenase (short-subunit alcohol dehydrogenase family)